MTELNGLTRATALVSLRWDGTTFFASKRWRRQALAHLQVPLLDFEVIDFEYISYYDLDFYLFVPYCKVITFS